MARRRRGPTLLEVLPSDMRRGGRHRVGYAQSTPPPVQAGDDEPIEMSRPLGWLSPGQVVRLPVGYLLIAAAGMVILAVAVFLIGYQTGGRAERLRAEERIRTYGPPTTDPLAGGFVDPAGSAADLGAGAGDASASTPGERTDTQPAVESTARDGASSPPPGPQNRPQSTPQRVRGLNYWIVSYTTPEEGERLVQFFAEHGLPARAYPASGGNVQVWVLRGYTAEERRSAEADAFERRLRQLGRIWKSERGGTDNLDTMWPKKY